MKKKINRILLVVIYPAYFMLRVFCLLIVLPLECILDAIVYGDSEKNWDNRIFDNLERDYRDAINNCK